MRTTRRSRGGTFSKEAPSIGYRGVLISNTLPLCVLLALFAMIGLYTPVWVVILLAFFYGVFTSLQYTSMNTLVYADTAEEQTSDASSIASTMQQMSISFGVAAAGLTTTFFIPTMTHGLHKALFVLGGLTIVSAIVFRNLKRGDGNTVNQPKIFHPGG